MSFLWPDLISLVANITTIFGVPILVVSTRKLYNDVKKAHEPRAVSQGCLQFDDVDNDLPVNLVPLEEITAIPRAGDNVLLPGMMIESDHRWHGAGEYRVIRVDFSYMPADEAQIGQPCPAFPSKIFVSVKRVEKQEPR
jgi:hypothetical protein